MVVIGGEINNLSEPLNKMANTLDDVTEMAKRAEKTVDRMFDSETMYILLFFLFSPILGIFFPIYTALLLGFLGLLVFYIIIFYKDFYTIVGPGSPFFDSLPEWLAWYIVHPFILLIGKPDIFFKNALKLTGAFVKFVIDTIFEFPEIFM
tara:strand:- start:2613 stop:3062 length:450 start_codon:yes stop_codon:yes gene_type:complete